MQRSNIINCRINYTSLKITGQAFSRRFLVGIARSSAVLFKNFSEERLQFLQAGFDQAVYSLPKSQNR